LNDLPRKAEQDRSFLESLGIRSVVITPSTYDARRKGILAIASYSRTGNWIRSAADQFPFVANMICVSLERKDAQDATNDSEERFRHLFEQAPVGMAVESLDGEILHVNKAFQAMTGYSEEEIQRLGCARMSHPDDAIAEERLFGELRQGLRPWYAIEKRFFRRDGSQMWGRVSVSFLTRKNGNTPLVMGMVSDITARKLAEEQLCASEARLTSTLEVLSSRIAILDEAGTILSANANWRKFARELPAGSPNLDVGANLFQVSHENESECEQLTAKVKEKARFLLQSDDPQMSSLNKFNIGGRDWWFRIAMSKFHESGRPRIVLSCEDVTGLMRAQEDLAQNQERLSLALEASKTGTWDWNISSGKVRWTDNRLVFAEEQNDFSGDFSEILELIHPEDRQTVEDLAVQALRSRGDTFSAQFRIAGPGGATRWVLAKGKISRDEQGRPIRVLGVDVDITELKQRDQELQRLAARLIEAHEEERKRISRELHDDIGQRVSLLACELEVRQQSLAKGKQANESLQIVKLQVQAEELASDIHELSHELHSSKLQLCGLELALRDLCDRHSQNHPIQIKLSTENISPEMAPEIALCLFRIAQEGVANAIRHAAPSVISIRAAENSGKLRLTIKDDGRGFDPSVQSKGIGLTSMRERLRLIGGTLRVKSSPGEGTEITAEASVPEMTAPRTAIAKSA
jgi:PAS domain S-box-containing protein